MARPEMMAIGDSLYNGVRSLSIGRDLAKWSVPAQVADALGLSIALPDYPRNVVVDMERWLRMFPDIGAIRDDVADNIRFWLEFPRAPSGVQAFHNLAIASTTWSDMLRRTWKSGDSEIATLQHELGSGIFELGGHLGRLFFAINTRFLLNPSAAADAPAMSSLDVVRESRPKRLIVSIGSNNGLWNMCFEADGSGFGDSDIQELREFMAALRELPAEIEHIYVNSLALPATVSNLMPIPDYAEYEKPPPGEYFDRYENRFGFGYGQLTAAEASVFDERLRRVNEAIAAEAQPDPRLHVVRMDEVLTSYDRKHREDASVVVADGKTLSNVMLESAPWPFPRFRSGGLQGLDGMHPTIVGYTLMARKLLDAIRDHENVSAATPSLEAAFEADSLLQQVPREWEIVLWTWRDIRRARALGRPRPAGAQEDATRRFMEAVQFKTS